MRGCAEDKPAAKEDEQARYARKPRRKQVIDLFVGWLEYGCIFRKAVDEGEDSDDLMDRLSELQSCCNSISETE